jgi:hypothetical protein
MNKAFGAAPLGIVISERFRMEHAAASFDQFDTGNVAEQKVIFVTPQALFQFFQ